MRDANYIIDLSFQADYSIEIIDFTQFNHMLLEHYYYPNANKTGGRDGIILKISPLHKKEWLGTFAFGYDSPKALTGIYSCPHPSLLCVISSGQGYIVNADSPTNWNLIESYPILIVYPVVEKNLIIFVDYTTISAYQSNNLLWRTKQLSWDGITLVEITTSVIRGKGWDASINKDVEFEVDLASGDHIGAMNFPEAYR